MYGHQGPVLSVCWNKVRLSWSSFHCTPSHRIIRVLHQDGTKILSGGADNAGRMFDITTGQSQQVAQHEAPIRVVKWIESPQGGILVTGSWDKTLKACRLACLLGCLLSLTPPLVSISTGTSERQPPSPLCNCLNGATP